MKKMIPFITRDIIFSQRVHDVNIFDVDFRVQIDSVKQPT